MSRTYTAGELKEILEKHRKWASSEAGGERANLEGAYLRGAYLRGADLRGADLEGADLEGANLEGAKDNESTRWPHYFIVPETGAFIGWKKVYTASGEHIILKLEIPAKAKRACSYVGRKCRAERARVLAAYTRDGKPTKEKTFVSGHNASFVWTVGKVVKPDSFNPDPRVECTNGIHFFITRKEAEEYA